MRRELMEELEADTTLEDIAEPYRLVVEMIGLKNVLKLSRYFMGDKIYLPKAERILAPARNRRIRREYNGRNAKELAKEYDRLSRNLFVGFTLFRKRTRSFATALPIPVRLFLFSIPVCFSDFSTCRS